MYLFIYRQKEKEHNRLRAAFTDRFNSVDSNSRQTTCTTLRENPGNRIVEPTQYVFLFHSFSSVSSGSVILSFCGLLAADTAALSGCCSVHSHPSFLHSVRDPDAGYFSVLAPALARSFSAGGRESDRYYKKRKWRTEGCAVTSMQTRGRKKKVLSD